MTGPKLTGSSCRVFARGGKSPDVGNKATTRLATIPITMRAGILWKHIKPP